jgi:hypothetical protein
MLIGDVHTAGRARSVIAIITLELGSIMKQLNESLLGVTRWKSWVTIPDSILRDEHNEYNEWRLKIAEDSEL